MSKKKRIEERLNADGFMQAMEASKVTGVDHQTIAYWAGRGYVDTVRVGGKVFIDCDDIRDRAKTSKPGRRADKSIDNPAPAIEAASVPVLDSPIAPHMLPSPRHDFVRNVSRVELLRVVEQGMRSAMKDMSFDMSNGLRSIVKSLMREVMHEYGLVETPTAPGLIQIREHLAGSPPLVLK